MANPPDRKALIAELAASRAALTGYATALRDDVALGAKLKRSFHANRTAWFSGAAVVGLLLSRLTGRRTKVVIHSPVAEAGKTGLVLSALKFGLNFAKPALVGWITDRWLSRSPKHPAA